MSYETVSVQICEMFIGESHECPAHVLHLKVKGGKNKKFYFAYIVVTIFLMNYVFLPLKKYIYNFPLGHFEEIMHNYHQII